MDWWKLELRSLDAAPNAQFNLAQFGPKQAWTAEVGGRPTTGSCLKTLSYIFYLTIPAVCAMTMWIAFSRGRELPYTAVGVLMALCVVVALCDEVSIRRHPRAVSRSVRWRINGVHLIPGAIILSIALPAPTLLNGFWLLPVVIDVALHLWKSLRGTYPKGAPSNPQENLIQSYGEVPMYVQRSSLQQRNTAIDYLHERGLIDAATTRRAQSTPFGYLALTEAPEVCSDFYPPHRWEPTNFTPLM